MSDSKNWRFCSNRGYKTICKQHLTLVKRNCTEILGTEPKNRNFKQTQCCSLNLGAFNRASLQNQPYRRISMKRLLTVSFKTRSNTYDVSSLFKFSRLNRKQTILSTRSSCKNNESKQKPSREWAADDHFDACA